MGPRGHLPLYVTSGSLDRPGDLDVGPAGALAPIGPAGTAMLGGTLNGPTA